MTGSNAWSLARLHDVGLETICAAVAPNGAHARTVALRELDITNVSDLLTYYPRKMIDRRNSTKIGDLSDGGWEAVVICKVVQVKPKDRNVTAWFGDETGRVMVSFFGQPWRVRQLAVGSTVALIGRPKLWNGMMTMSNPLIEVLDDDAYEGRIVAIYPQSGKAPIASWQIGQLVDEAIDRWERKGVADPLPAAERERLGLLERGAAFRQIHRPDDEQSRRQARERLAFDELFRLQLILALDRAARDATEVGIRHPEKSPLVTSFVRSLPFSLTGAQARVIREIAADMARTLPMHRLVQGDVGAGKTYIGVTTLLRAVEGGTQGALMAPTEVLARQLYKDIAEAFEALAAAGGPKINAVLLRSKMKVAERREILAGLADGTVHVAVGTHALLEDEVRFARLGVVVIDEQHRFGVDQRQTMRAKNADGTIPDTLVMTATPIPRTAAMTVYGDLTVSILDELPPGRTPIVTKWSPVEDEAVAAIRSAVADGRQAYIVCSLVEGSEKAAAAAVDETAARLASGPLAGLKIGVVHGKLKSDEKESVMAAFCEGSLDVLVSTTVIEVGVNVPNSTVIAILNADRFGIAQLHQLRGRVGRGRHASQCWLICDPEQGKDAPTRRIQALVDSTNGFELAEIDLELRGEGQIFGTTQSGRSDLKLARLSRDRELCEKARDVASRIVAADPTLANHEDLREELDALCAAWAQELLQAS